MSPGSRPSPSLASHGQASPTTRSATPRITRKRCIAYLALRRFAAVGAAAERVRFACDRFAVFDREVARGFGFARAATALTRAAGAVVCSPFRRAEGFARRFFVDV